MVSPQHEPFPFLSVRSEMEVLADKKGERLTLKRGLSASHRRRWDVNELDTDDKKKEEEGKEVGRRGSP